MRDIRSQFEARCRSQLQGKLEPTAKSQAPVSIARWMSDIADPAEYCACATANFFDGMTPEFMRNATPEQSNARAKRAGTACVLPKLKASFTAFCNGMLREMTPAELRSPGGDEITAEMCRCTQPTIDAVTAESFEPFMAASLRDYAQYQRSRVLPAPGPQSLIAQMNECGFHGLRARLESAR